MKYYSQFGQDQFLYENTAWTLMSYPLIFVDIGAHDGVTGNNTKFFEESLGWHGICFEPIPEVYDKLIQNRSCKCFNVAIGDTEGYQAFRVIHGYAEMLSGFVNTYSNEHFMRANDEIRQHGGYAEVVEVLTKRFDTMVPWQHIDYLSIDTEGSEEMILKSIPYDKYEIDYMSVEFNVGASESLHQFLMSQGYQLMKQLGCDRIYRHSRTIF